MNQQADARDEIPLGLESAWPGSDQLAIIFGGPAAVQGLDSSSSSYPQRDAEAGAAFPLRAAGFALAALLWVATPPAGAAPYAPQEYDFSGLPALQMQVFGVVESVRDLSVRPGAQELVVRLDDGRELRVTQNGMQHFRPGERIRLSTISPNLRKETAP